MKKYSSEFPVGKMAHVFKVSRSGYYRYINKKPSSTENKNRNLACKIKSIFECSRGIYGSPRVHAMLKKQGETCSRKRVAKIMRRNNIYAKTKKRWRPTQKTGYRTDNISPNLLNQNFTTSNVNTIWVQDMTYIDTNEGWLYLSTVLDLYSRKIVGLSMGSCIDTKLVIRSLEQAIRHRNPSAGVILHSDRGTQYTSTKYKDFAKKNNFVLSMSAKGNCYDNAVMESFFHTLKTEHVFFRKFKTRQEAITSIFEYIEVFYNRYRIHSTLNFMSPQDFEQQQLIKNENQMESRVKSPCRRQRQPFAFNM